MAAIINELTFGESGKSTHMKGTMTKLREVGEQSPMKSLAVSNSVSASPRMPAIVAGRGRRWRVLVAALLTLALLLVVLCPPVAAAASSSSSSTSNTGHKRTRQNIRRPDAAVQQLPLPTSTAAPRVFNVAPFARISANATCGGSATGREEFCRLAGPNRNRRGGQACGVCDASGPDLAKRHPIQYAVDGTAKWWQSPTLQHGPQYETVTITLDLRQIFQVTYVIIKAANAPRPGTWILERSLDGVSYLPWQYYAITDQECWERFGIPPTPGEPHYKTATEVICTSYYSKLFPLENGEIHTSFTNRQSPEWSEWSAEVQEFTRARWVRLRLLRLRAAVLEVSSSSAPKWLTSGAYWEGPQARVVHGAGVSEAQLAKRLYYSIKDISIGAHCDCNGHATTCIRRNDTQLYECECEHNTCGMQCESCCPMHNQLPYKSITAVQEDQFACELCECYGHATSCRYDPTAALEKLSLDITGRYRGGGICINCSDFTTGVNCEQCLPGFFQPADRTQYHSEPCVPCDCHPAGSTGDCLREAFLEEQTVGDCVCKPGFMGPRCSECAPGHRGFPECGLCPCDPKGTMPDGDCEGNCNCKFNVEGPTCSKCKPGYFALQAQNFEGCLPCYCSGVSNICESTIPVPQIFETLDGWLVSDITVTYTAKPTVDTDTNWLLIGNNEFHDLHESAKIEAYYWLAPPLYLGNKLEAYGSTLRFTLNWVVMRGDTSGKPTTGPNLILIGANGLRIALGETTFSGKNSTVHVLLTERNWYHVPRDVKDIVTRLRRTDTAYRGDAVTRPQFLSVLSNLKSMLVRAKFHTDQIEAALEQTVLEVQPDGGATVGSQSLVERCSCPTGYTGLSCENCDYGFVKIDRNISTHVQHVECVKCDCNGHSRSCNLETSECECEHNTIGDNCQRCAVGYYGKPSFGTANDCKRCACPLLNADNNFSPSCQLDMLDFEEGEEYEDDNAEDYVCTQCPHGYTGDHCEICDDGFFGDPTLVGSSCQPCECNGGPCDRLSGQCLSCRGNTEGWRCERCRAEHFGDPTTTNCQPCQCDPQGAESQQCDPISGQCECLERLTGRTCSECESGFGNVTAGCKVCTCHEIGAVSGLCDPVSGVCECRPGVEGFHCDACMHLYYGFSLNGCQSCGCNTQGSELLTCDIVSGQCRCKPHVIGRTCDTCESGYWGLESKGGCSLCQCDPIGSANGSCDSVSGQCECKPGVGGPRCDTCLDRHYGFSDLGCKECDYCDVPGRVCDPDTGRCVCPPFSHGENCNRCTPNSWGFEPSRGCKACQCDTSGALRMQCDAFTGRCACRDGYTGEKCNGCAAGFYGYPRCRKCNCNLLGTEEYSCNRTAGICPCDEQGQCLCKVNVMGKKCDTCKNGTFGLEKYNPEGCTQCFCFGRSTHCTQAGIIWGQIRLKSSRELMFEPVLPPARLSSNLAYIQHILPKRYHFSSTQNSERDPNESTTIYAERFNETKGLYIIPEQHGNITVGVYEPFTKPLYWKLPDIFNGDHIVSYGGYLQFKTQTDSESRVFPTQTLNTYPLVLIRGNGITIAHFPLFAGKPEVRFHESLWMHFHGVGNVKDHRSTDVTREMLMVVLQNIQEILIRVSDQEAYTKAVLYDAVMDTAILVKGQPTLSGNAVELCECPSRYDSSSCQNPSIGFFRWHKPNPSPGSTIIIDLIGDVKLCECNGRSSVCDIETGYCMNCTNNTAGTNCEVCAEGFYGNAQSGDCKRCPCHNAAKSCYKSSAREFVCNCKTGYKGKQCEQCSMGYFRNRNTGACDSCQCNLDGRASEECDQESGQCNCKPGVKGKDCSRCEQRRFILDNNHCIPCDHCTYSLLDKVDEMDKYLANESNRIAEALKEPPYELLENIAEASSQLLQQVQTKKRQAEEILNHPLSHYDNMLSEASASEKRLKYLKWESHQAAKNASHVRKRAEKIKKKLAQLNRFIFDTVTELELFGLKEKHVNVQKSVQEGTRLLEEIRKVDLSDDVKEASDILLVCSRIYSRLNGINTSLEDFYFKLDDIRRIVGQIEDKATATKRITQLNRQNFNQLENILNQIEIGNMNIEKVSKENKNISGSTQDLLNLNAELNREIEDKKMALEVLLTTLQTKETASNELVEQVQNIKDYARSLKQDADKYANIFKTTKDTAHKSIEASQVYKNIVKMLNSARAAAQDAIDVTDRLNQQLYPANEDSLVDKAFLVLAKSSRVKNGVEIQRTNIKNLQNKQLHLNKTIERIIKTLWNTGLEDNDISKKLAEFNSTNTETMKAILQNATKLSAAMKALYQRAYKIIEDKSYKLMPAFNDLNASEANISVTLSRADENLTEAQTKMNMLNETLESFDTLALTQKETMNRWNTSLADKLQTLKNKVAEARRLASEIQIPLASKKNLKCARTYRPYVTTMINTTSTYISFTISLPSDLKNSPLFYLAGTGKQFIAIEMINNTIRLLWNLGNDTGIVEHPELIKHLTEHSGYYYDVEVERIRNIGKLSVRKKFLSNGTTIPQTEARAPVIRTTDSHFTILNLGAMSEVWIGGVPTGVRNPLLLKKQGLQVAIYDLVLNDKPIGLWNYVRNIKNTCKSDYYWTYTLSEYHFNGAGYSVREVKNPFLSVRMSITLTFKTFDENALLLAIVSIKNNSFISISLRDGHIVYRVQYVDEAFLEIVTEQKYNNGQRIHIEGSRDFNRKKVENAILKVDGKMYLGAPNMPVMKKQLPDLKLAKYYIGGIPSKVQDAVITMPPYSSLLGCLSDIEIERVRYDPVDTEHDGVDYSCSEKTLNKVGFFGKGYIKLNLKSTLKFNSISFVFVSQRENALLAFMVLNTEIAQEHSYVLVRLTGGTIECEVKDGDTKKFLRTKRQFNDGHSHAFSLIKEQKNMELRLDDMIEDTAARVHGFGEVIYFGGFPDTENGDMIVTDHPFEGTIRDVIVNDELVLFNAPLDFKHVQIGRDGPAVSMAPMEIGVRTMPLGISSIDNGGCNKDTNYSTELGALKFGDGPFSHAQHPLPIANFWHKSFTLEFEFRTYYPNGMLFVSPGLRERQRQRHHILLQIKNRTVHLSIKVRNNKELHLPNKVNDGQWHRVLIKSKEKKWTLIVDNASSNAIKIPKKLNVANVIYVGAWPQYGNRLPTQFVQELQPFKGCVRNLKVNGVVRDLTSDFLHNTRECFPNIERGSYFPGDAYAVYQKNFQVPPSLLISFEFRTSELSGVLLTTGGTNNPPAFSIELQNGKVILSAQVNTDQSGISTTKSVKPIRVEVSLLTPYDICDNQWHNVTAFYSENELITLQVDDASNNAYITDTNNQIAMSNESALYVGGIPDASPTGTLQTRDNFHGCIRNVVIGNDKRDWTEMDELHNVLLSSCPLP